MTITIRAVRDDLDAARIHAATQFDLSKISRESRYVLQRTKVRISAAGTCSGLTVHELDQMLAEVSVPKPLDAQERIGLKMELMAKGILLAPKSE